MFNFHNFSLANASFALSSTWESDDYGNMAVNYEGEWVGRASIDKDVVLQRPAHHDQISDILTDVKVPYNMMRLPISLLSVKLFLLLYKVQGSNFMSVSSIARFPPTIQLK